MLCFDKIPQYVYDILSKNGVQKEDIYLLTYCDMDTEHTLCDTYIAATKESLFVLSGNTVLDNVKDKRHSVSAFWEEKRFSQYNLSHIEKVMVEELLSTSRLVAVTTSGENIFLAAMTNFCKENSAVFVKYFARMKKGELKSSDFSVDPEDNPDFNRCPKCGMRYPDKNRKICPRCMEKGKLFIRCAAFFTKYKKELVILILSLVVLTGTSILVPYFSNGFFFDNVLTEGGNLYGQIVLAIGIIMATRLLSSIADIINGYVSSKISAKIIFDLKNTIFGAIEKLSLRFFTGRQTGGLMTQVNSDSNTIYHFFNDTMPYFLINIVQVVVVLIILFSMNPLLAALSLGFGPLFFVIMRLSYGHTRKLQAHRYSGVSRVTSHLSDVLGGIRVVKAFANEELENKRFGKGNVSAINANKRLALFNSYAYRSVGIIFYLGNVVSLGVGGYMVMKGYFTYGQLITFTAYINMIYSPMQFFSQMIDMTASCSNAMQRLFEIYDTEPEVSEKQDAITPENIKGEVEFRNVDFGYNKNKKVLSNVTFTIAAEQTLGIVGHTGAGKSTLANLLMRLYDTDEGGIYIDGINVRDLSFEALHKNIAMVSQETYLFIGSIFENIRYAKPDASYDEVIAAAKISGAHDFIVKLPDAYDTKVGFGNTELSGGERQRISIARAILLNPKILILDEAPAAMDTRTEKMIQNALNTLTQGKTTIIIAHRLSTLKDADKLIAIEDGRVVEEGTHKSLLEKKDGVYNRLYTLQTKALKEAGIVE